MENVYERLQFLYDQVHQTSERVNHLHSALPMDIRPRSLNYGEDLQRLMAEYNSLVRQATESGAISKAALLERRLPWRMGPEQ